MSERPLFILAGNGPYLNRGCEAIVRGTVNILRQQYNNPKFICISHFNSKEEFEEQQRLEVDDDIQHYSSFCVNNSYALSNFYRPKVWQYAYRSLLNKKNIGYSIYGDILQKIPEAKAILSIGGDNYSLDYGIPFLFTTLDDLILRENKPMIIWGASVGPFSSIPTYENYMSTHLKKVTGIFARESETTSYLESIGVKDNVYSVADPAFMMDPENPFDNGHEILIEPESIGLNLSPLMAKYVCGGNLLVWQDIASSIIEEIASKFERPIYLIPHVTQTANNDYEFLKGAMAKVHQKKNIILVPPTFSAAETKWILGRMSLFAGARTHATIAALSMGVPTLSFSYSLKAIGINKDIFGHDSFVVKPTDLTPKMAVEGLSHLDESSEEIADMLRGVVPLRTKGANLGGVYLKKLLETIG